MDNNLKPIYEIMTAWNDQLIRHDKIRRLREAVMSCETMGELRRLFDANFIFLCNNPEVCDMFEYAFERIRRVRNEQMLSWKLQLN
jgi:hypothetical protein